MSALLRAAIDGFAEAVGLGVLFILTALAVTISFLIGFVFGTGLWTML